MPRRSYEPACDRKPEPRSWSWPTGSAWRRSPARRIADRPRSPTGLRSSAVPDVVMAPAKLTVSLRITGVRADGYHLIDAEMVSVDLSDRLTFSDGDGLDLHGAGPDVPTDGRNLVARALSAVDRRAHVRVDKSEEHTSELQSLMRISYAVFCL